VAIFSNLTEPSWPDALDVNPAVLRTTGTTGARAISFTTLLAVGTRCSERPSTHCMGIRQAVMLFRRSSFSQARAKEEMFGSEASQFLARRG
jgi:hypothetical protein